MRSTFPLLARALDQAKSRYPPTKKTGRTPAAVARAKSGVAAGPALSSTDSTLRALIRKRLSAFLLDLKHWPRTGAGRAPSPFGHSGVTGNQPVRNLHRSTRGGRAINRHAQGRVQPRSCRSLYALLPLRHRSVAGWSPLTPARPHATGQGVNFVWGVFELESFPKEGRGQQLDPPSKDGPHDHDRPLCPG